MNWTGGGDTAQGRQVPFALAVASTLVGMVTGLAGVVIGVVTVT